MAAPSSSISCVLGYVQTANTACMKVGRDGNLGLSREYYKKLFGPVFNSWCNCPLKSLTHSWSRTSLQEYRLLLSKFSNSLRVKYWFAGDLRMTNKIGF